MTIPPLNWFVFALIGGSCFGLHAVLVQLTLTEKWTAMVVNTYFFTLGAIVLWLYSAYSRNLPMPDARVGIKLLLIALVAVVGFWSVFKGYELAPNLGYVRAVFSVNVVVAFLLSVVLFGQSVNPRALLGMFLTIAGTAVLALA